ncbi:DUF155-domain-containing protein [Rozella allomycis CSF55]|uniref:DUF155-domain-containing protein n=1 Tax=Rozella allomycis (strain CSF55) TaxID=988480 RepID=A0A075APF4_ROZAC|nr:Protein of unknown function DUF155 domain-containing protein [Rozella allomycis CSF55]RKP22023.1 DUF155-domain-containing protein [Rozella allomycis CSF55]|eukprot:EPZ31974.1 Protein of unknown function DUF155 domain-containing protein [Rozella allomycis CSF55]
MAKINNSKISTLLHKRSRTNEEEEPPNQKSEKNYHKVNRTTKNNQKLVIFPPDDRETCYSDDILSDNDLKENSPPVYRVSAYLFNYCLVDLVHIATLLKSTIPLIETRLFEEALYVPFHPSIPSVLSKDQNIESKQSSDDFNGKLFIFDYGVAVFWGLSEKDEIDICRALIPLSLKPVEPSLFQTDNLMYHIHDSHSKSGIYNDIITLKSSPSTKTFLTLSHALAQSVKLALFEDLVQQSIDATSGIPKQLAEEGNVFLSREEITKLIGELFSVRINVNLVSNVLDTPEFFWNQPNLERLYLAARSYLEVSQRVAVLNQRVSVISDLLQMLRDHSTNHHATSLELIVIVLIFMSVVVGVVEIVIFMRNSHCK